MASHQTHPLDRQVAAVRGFNRFYTRKLGVLDQQLLESPYSLTEARVLYELEHRENLSAKEIAADLGLDAGYLSRILQRFQDKDLITRKPLPADRRHHQLALTAKGRLAIGRLVRSSYLDIGAMLGRLPPADGERLVTAMATIEHVLGGTASPRLATLRGPKPGDIGWVVQSHGALYAKEYGFDATFEALVADIAGSFLTSHNTARERCWIAELDGRPVGSIFLMRQSDEVAKLRLLLVDPAGRGQGLGQRLVGECIGFAREAGYRRISLWTQSNLLAARGIYQAAGFELVAIEPHHSFGVDLVGETWELRL